MNKSFLMSGLMTGLLLTVFPARAELVTGDRGCDAIGNLIIQAVVSDVQKNGAKSGAGDLQAYVELYRLLQCDVSELRDEFRLILSKEGELRERSRDIGVIPLPGTEPAPAQPARKQRQ